MENEEAVGLLTLATLLEYLRVHHPLALWDPKLKPAFARVRASTVPAVQELAGRLGECRHCGLIASLERLEFGLVCWDRQFCCERASNGEIYAHL